MSLVVLALLFGVVQLAPTPAAQAGTLSTWVATNVHATSTSTTITLSWSAPKKGIPNGYVVGRDGVNSAGVGTWQTPTPLSPSTFSYTFSSLLPGTTYHVWVQPVSGGKTTVTAITTTGAATNVAATATSTSVTLTWGAPTAGTSGYNVGRDGYDSAGHGAWQTSTPLSSSTRSYTFTSLLSSTTYHVWVKPVGGWSTTVTVTTAAATSTTTNTTTTSTTTSTTVAPSTSTTVKPAVGAYVGAINLTRLATFGTNTQKTPTVGFDFLDGSSWSGLTSANWLLDPWTTWLKANSSRRLVLSVPMLVSGYAGQYDNTALDTYFQQLAANIASRGIAGQVTIRLGWEMNGTWFPWGDGNYAGYIRMWRRIVPKMRAYGAFRFDWCPNGFDLNAPKWYPGDDVVDYVGTDTYDIIWGKAGGDPTWRWSIVGKNVQNQATFAAAHAKQAVLDEWAVWTITDTVQGGGGDDPTYVSNMLNWATSHNYAYTAYFDVTAGGVGTTLEQNPNSLNAYRAAA